MAWSETTLGYLHSLSCEDPLSGLSSLAHVRSRLSELHRAARRPGAEEIQRTHALVVIEVPGAESDIWSRSLRLALLSQTARTVFGGEETIGRLGRNRVIVIARRDASLPRRVGLLRRLTQDTDSGSRAWIEGLPAEDRATAALLDELART